MGFHHLRTIIQKELDNRGIDIKFSLASNPEFLKEGDAVSDFMKPDRIILGCEDEVTEKTLRDIYSPFCRDRDRCILMDIRSSEFPMYAYLTLKKIKETIIKSSKWALNIKFPIINEMGKVQNNISTNFISLYFWFLIFFRLIIKL